jgi:hypothetical protein
MLRGVHYAPEYASIVGVGQALFQRNQTLITNGRAQSTSTQEPGPQVECQLSIMIRDPTGWGGRPHGEP